MGYCRRTSRWLQRKVFIQTVYDIPNKSDRYGLKISVVVDARNFYPIKSEVYIGIRGELNNKPGM